MRPKLWSRRLVLSLALALGLAGKAAAGPATVVNAMAVREFQRYCDINENLECETEVYICTGSPGVHIGYLDNLPYEAFFYRAGLDFDVSSIPDNAKIIKVELEMYTKLKIGVPYGVEVHAMPEPVGPTPPGGPECFKRYAQVYNGVLYDQDYGAWFVGYHTFELNSQARQDLRERLLTNTFTVGLRVTDELPQAEGTLEISGVSQTNPNRLKVTWVLENPGKTPSLNRSWGTLKALYP